MATTWGKKAANRIDRNQFSKDELLKSLGSQFNVDFNYEQWTRKQKIMRPPPPPRAADGSRTVVIGRAKSADSTCQHGRGGMIYVPSIREKKQAAKKLELDKERSERIKIIELRTKTRKKTLQEYSKRSHELLEENIKLRNEIEGDEHHVMDRVKGLLRKYEKFRGGITTLNLNFNIEYEQATKELHETRVSTQRKLGALEKELAAVDAQLKKRQEELHTLMNYKDKEYPVKAMLIATLQKDIQTLKISNQEDQEDLEHIVFTELNKYEKERSKDTYEITQDVTESAISMMHPSLKDMALQNKVMKKEIDINKVEQENLLRVNRELEKDIHRLLRDPKTNTRLQMFPEFFPTQEKCTPDMDVILDIPTHQYLPI